MEPANRLQETKEYYFSRKLKEVRSLAAAGYPIINMGIGSPDLPAPQLAIDALVASLNDKVAHQYQSYIGIPELREAMACFYKSQYNLTLDAEREVLPLMGSKEGIMHISMAFLNPGDKVLIPNPGYPTYAAVTKLVEAQTVPYNLREEKGWLPDLEELEKQDLSAVKLMWVNYPHMPTGATVPEGFFEKLIAFAKANKILIINDNPYSFILNEHPQSLLATKGAKEVALELNSLSKTFNMAGWRVGMLAGSAEHLGHILRVKSNMDSGMFYSLQKGAIAALNLDQKWNTELNTIYKKRQALVFQLVEKLGCTYDKNQVGLFVWAKLPYNQDAEIFIDSVLREKFIFITPGTVFGSMGKGYIRLSLCVTAKEIKEAITRFDAQ
ncbi:pyridoxal phosphate-dependent aminotransferase [Dokdonia sp. Hel_I_53]|uniref:pyridoxal phosphate-dependent aminotransferase n=1 Tax=Dokdonia sp. Hel_I_53 TaxID=1566287 RepID=UPI001199BE6C|nr:aminotransferase class I/II-fold pyridoxal phosphate-dependent enzyme [Dokdonia sp. Hel_I_53]TVZ53196.1 aspartate/methionine/tyrosine aminotransferase [Dokdonia sp. Hel_I_53]